MSLAEAVRQTAAEVDLALDALLPQPHGFHGRVQEAMRYAVQAGGKRLRPFLVLETAALFGVPRDRAMRVACAAAVRPHTRPSTRPPPSWPATPS